MSDEFENNTLNQSEQNPSSHENSAQYSFWTEQMGQTNTYTNPTQGMNSQSQNIDQTYQPYQQEQGYHPNYSNIGGGQPPYQNNTMGAVPPKQPRQRKPHPKLKKAGILIGKAACFGLIAGIMFVGANEVYYKLNPQASVTNVLDLATGTGTKLSTTEVLQNAVVPDTDVTKVYNSVLPSIVAIDCTFSQSYSIFGQTYSQDAEGSGSGIIIDETDSELLIATNNHVVNGANTVKITFIDGTSAEAVVKGTDASADLAVVSVDISGLKADTKKAIKVATLGDSDSVKEGELAIAIGNALGYGQSITVGYISALNRQVTIDNDKMTLMQTDAAINPGNSGGALINAKGQVIGINSAKLAVDSVEGMGYAIPISQATPIINELKSREIIKEADQGYLGVYIQDITENIASKYSMPVGVFIREFPDNSAAKEAGLQEGDIITAVDGVEVSSSSALKEKIISYKYGTTVKVTVQRANNGKYEEKKIDVKLGKKPADDASSKSNENQQQSPNLTLPTPGAGEENPGQSQDPQNPGSGEGGSQTDPFSDFFGYGN